MSLAWLIHSYNSGPCSWPNTVYAFTINTYGVKSMKMSAATVTHHPSLLPLLGAYLPPDWTISSSSPNLPSGKTLLLILNRKLGSQWLVPPLSLKQILICIFLKKCQELRGWGVGWRIDWDRLGGPLHLPVPQAWVLSTQSDSVQKIQGNVCSILVTWRMGKLKPRAGKQLTVCQWGTRWDPRWSEQVEKPCKALPTPSAAKFWLLNHDQVTELFKPYFSHLDRRK